MSEDILKRLGDILKDDHNAFTRATAIAAQAEIMRLEERSKGLRRERDSLRAKLTAEKAEKVARGKMLVRIRNKLIHALGGLDDQGDQVVFGSTNDADMFRDAVRELDDFKWSLIMAEKDEPDILEKCRDANERADKAEAERDSLRAELAKSELVNEAHCHTIEELNSELAAERADKTRIAEGWNKASDERDALRAELAAEREQSGVLLGTIECNIAMRMNGHLYDMKQGFDDSISGFNDAWDVVKDALKDTRARIDAALAKGGSDED